MTGNKKQKCRRKKSFIQNLKDPYNDFTDWSEKYLFAKTRSRKKFDHILKKYIIRDDTERDINSVKFKQEEEQ